ncbi:hypothetical protein DBR40_05225 [Pedobacter sp. KBW01]|uniref:hypothetical protein n=1 Tax=Pedobacter sp. KBW01 TaxID=2153364 RepID=UPI000F59E508|nr:hypothetical protein [Pedobacter sp. KBW01]RQO79122.1 hypothetical protein DBR40_05225 [Pedobacter sp. KBW01]
MSETAQVFLGIFGGGSIGVLFTLIATRGKTKAEAGNIHANTDNIIADTYGKLLDEVRETVKFQGEQIKASQEREVEYLKIINGHQETERELRGQIKALEIKLSLRITKIEKENQ